MVFRGEHLVKQSTMAMDAAYQTWALDALPDDAARDAACREKSRGFCARNHAPDARCRFEVHTGENPGGWDAAHPIDAPMPKGGWSKAAQAKPKAAKSSKQKQNQGVRTNRTTP